jgi:hypothetical protein
MQMDAQQGWRRNDQSQLGIGRLRGWREVGAARLEGGITVSGSGWRSPGFVPVPQFNARAVRDAIDPTDGGRASRVIAHGRLSRPLGATQFEATLWGQAVRSTLFLNIPEPGLELGQSRERDARALGGMQAQVGWRALGGEATVGSTARLDAGTYSLVDTRARVLGEQTVGYDARYAAGALYARWRRVIATRLGVDVGARWDVLHYRANNQLDSAGWQGGTHAIPSPKLGVRYLAGTHWALTASSSAGFRGALGVIGDPARAPFRAWAHESGVEYTRAALRARVTAFRTDVRDERIQDPVTRVISAAGRSRRQGLDLFAEWRVGMRPELRDGNAAPPRLRVAIGTTINDATVRPPRIVNTDTAGGVRANTIPLLSMMAAEPTATPRLHDGPHAPPLSGQRIPGVARYTGRLESELATIGGTTIGAAWRVFGPFVPISEPDVETRAASVLDLSLALPLERVARRGLVLDVAVLNTLNVRFVENRSAGFVTPGLPRTVRVGLRTGAADRTH